MEETSLTDFLEADGADADGEDAEGEENDAVEDPTPGTRDADAVEAAETTAAWAPAGDSGGACEACGDPADWRWRDGDALVCADCKCW